MRNGKIDEEYTPPLKRNFSQPSTHLYLKKDDVKVVSVHTHMSKYHCFTKTSSCNII